MSEYEGLAAALAKAQASFPTISRDKEVRVTSERTGKSYTFKYAPLDKILDKVRGPLSDNGLSIIQLLDEDVLVTSLLHSSGAMISGRTPIPATEGIQAYGSAITYLRRYAIQALLGIAAEEDDDGNSAAGNRATFGGKQEMDTNGGLIGTAVKQRARTTDFSLRETADGGAHIGFRLASGAGAGVICEARDDLARVLPALEADIIGQRLQVWGAFVTYGPEQGVQHPYKAFRVTRIQTPTMTIPASEGAPGAVPEAQASPEPPMSVGEDAPDEPSHPVAAGGNVTEAAPQTPAASAPDDLCGADSPYGDGEHCELLTGHRGAHTVLSLAFPEKWEAA